MHTLNTISRVLSSVPNDTRTQSFKTAGIRWSWALFTKGTRLVQSKVSYQNSYLCLFVIVIHLNNLNRCNSLTVRLYLLKKKETFNKQNFLLIFTYRRTFKVFPFYIKFSVDPIFYLQHFKNMDWNFVFKRLHLKIKLWEPIKTDLEYTEGKQSLC